jgi:hypothetical protein
MATNDGIHIKGLAELMSKYGAAGPVVHDTLFKATDRAVTYVHSTVPPYPAKPAGSRYARTEMLGRATTTKVKPLGGGGFVGTIGNKMKHAPWVISTERVGSRGPQTRVHKSHGWWTLQEVVSAASREVYRIFHEAVITILKQL